MPVITRLAARRVNAGKVKVEPRDASRIAVNKVSTTTKGAKARRRHSHDNTEFKEENSDRRRPSNHFGLVQEIYQHNLYHLIVQAILWNQTRGKQAIIILRLLLEKYPCPHSLALANEDELADLLHPIGLFRQRAKRLIALGQAWMERPPRAGVVYKVRYQCHPDDSLWEIAHLPGVGKYCIDSYRIFHRDQLLKLSYSWDDHQRAHHRDIILPKRPKSSIDPEWKRVSPDDKDLSAFVQWAWKRETNSH